MYSKIFSAFGKHKNYVTAKKKINKCKKQF